MDAEGPLVRLKNLLLNQDTLLTIAQWVTVSFLPSSTGKPVESSLSCYQLRLSYYLALIFLQTYWYGVLLMGIGFVITMALFIKCFAAHTPSR